MNIYEEIYLISNLIKAAQINGKVDLTNPSIHQSLFLNSTTIINEDYFFNLDKNGIIDYEEVGEDGFTPIIICNIKKETNDYLKKLILNNELENNKLNDEIENLQSRISDILTFNPDKLSNEIYGSKKSIENIKIQIANNQILNPLSSQLDEIEKNLNSILIVSERYEEVYKNIILPVKSEGAEGVRQTVKWAIISIILSSIISTIITLIIN